MKSTNNYSKLVAAAALITTSSAFAAGFEKATTFSAEHTSMGSAVVSSVSGADALYYNPAGLSNIEGKGNATLSFSPAFSKFTAPISRGTGGASTLETSTKRGMSPIFGALVSYKISDKLGAGLGAYVAGGSNAMYEDMDFSAVNATTVRLNAGSRLGLTEIAFGAGYKISPNFSVGASWRASLVSAKLVTVGSGTTFGLGATTLAETSYNDLSDKNFKGFRLGAQYSKGDLGIGMVFRSAIDFTADGTISQRAMTAGSTAATSGPANGLNGSLSSQFPLMFGIGAHLQMQKNMKVALAYEFAQYSKNEFLVVNTNGTDSNLTLQWKNQHQVRIGAEIGGKIPMRLGYVFVSQVTNKSFAGASFASPGIGHMITAGTSYDLSDNLVAGIGGDYGFASGTATGTVPGEYKSNVYSVHASVNYKF